MRPPFSPPGGSYRAGAAQLRGTCGGGGSRRRRDGDAHVGLGFAGAAVPGGGQRQRQALARGQALARKPVLLPQRAQRHRRLPAHQLPHTPAATAHQALPLSLSVDSLRKGTFFETFLLCRASDGSTLMKLSDAGNGIIGSLNARTWPDPMCRLVKQSHERAS